MNKTESPKYLIERAKRQLSTWKLVRGEHFLSYIGVHPKALEYFDSHQDHSTKNHIEIWEECKIGVDTPRNPLPIEYLRVLITGYTSAREYFIDQLALKITSSVYESKTNKVIFRTTDFKSHDLKDLIGSEYFEVKERSPQIGNRGLGRYLQPAYHELFDWELEACRRAASNYQIELSILFPFVRTPSQLKQGLARVTDLGVKPTAIGMMIEVPNNVFMVQDFINVLKDHTNHYHETPMFLFGLADLTQTIGVVSRDDPVMVRGFKILDPAVKGIDTIVPYDEAAPVVVKSVEHVLSNALEQGVQCGIHTDTLESITGRNPDFAALLTTYISFLVEDHCLVNDLEGGDDQ